MDNEKKTEVLEIAEWQATHAQNYWVLHPEYELSDWQSEIINDDTRQSYHQWVESRIIEKHGEFS